MTRRYQNRVDVGFTILLVAPQHIEYAKPTSNGHNTNLRGIKDTHSETHNYTALHTYHVDFAHSYTLNKITAT